MSATQITWEQWYRTFAAAAVHTLRAHIERESASAALGSRMTGQERWAITPAGLAALRAAARGATTAITPALTGSFRCPWCGRAIRQGEAVTVIGGRPLHNVPCLAEHDAAAGDDSNGASDDGRTH